MIQYKINPVYHKVKPRPTQLDQEPHTVSVGGDKDLIQGEGELTNRQVLSMFMSTYDPPNQIIERPAPLSTPDPSPLGLYLLLEELSKPAKSSKLNSSKHAAIYMLRREKLGLS